jgi:hypothetical protein
MKGKPEGKDLTKLAEQNHLVGLEEKKEQVKVRS